MNYHRRVNRAGSAIAKAEAINKVQQRRNIRAVVGNTVLTNSSMEAGVVRAL